MVVHHCFAGLASAASLDHVPPGLVGHIEFAGRSTLPLIDCGFVVAIARTCVGHGVDTALPAVAVVVVVGAVVVVAAGTG